MLKGILLGSVAAVGLGAVLLAGVSLLVPGPDPQRGMTPPQAPVLRAGSEPLPQQPDRPAPAPAAETAATKTTVAREVELPAGSEFNRPPEDGPLQLAEPAASERPDPLASDLPRASALPGDMPVADTASAAQPETGDVVAMVAPPLEGDAPRLPETPREAPPQTFREVTTPEPQADGPEEEPPVAPEATEEPAPKAEMGEAADPITDTASLQETEAPTPAVTPPAAPPSPTADAATDEAGGAITDTASLQETEAPTPAVTPPAAPPSPSADAATDEAGEPADDPAPEVGGDATVTATAQLDREASGPEAPVSDAAAEGAGASSPSSEARASARIEATPPEVASEAPAQAIVRAVPGDEVVTGAPRAQDDLPPVIRPVPDAPEAEEPDTPAQMPRRLVMDSERGPQDPGARFAADAEGADAPALVRHAAPFEAPAGLPLFGILLIDDGSGGVERDSLAALDFPVAFAVDPSAPDAAEAARRYRAAGHEVLLLGRALSPEGAAQDVEVALQGARDAVPEALGVLDGPAGRFGDNRETLSALLPALAEDGMGFVAWPGGLGSEVDAALDAGVPSAQLYRVLDGRDERAAVITRYLDRATFEAAQTGATLVVGRATPEVVTALYSWQLGGRTDEVAIAPVSAVLRATVGG